MTEMKQLWTMTSNGIGLLFVALGVILADNRGSIEVPPGGFPAGTARR